ncbi:MAG: hypothetical protein K0R21_422 [Anaerocolumna sp.]|jgi:outer membrane biosynthesis protein TonB|nr:hypothetical protein [Anaerocolumna sp.]
MGIKMKLKYYLRGLGVGILLTTVVLSIAYGRSEKNAENELTAQNDMQETQAIDKDDINMEDLLTPTSSAEESELEESEATTETKPVEESETEAETVAEEESEATDETKPVEESEATTETKPVEEAKTAETKATNETEANAETKAESETATEAKEAVIEIERGMTSEDVARLLERNGIINDSADFNRYLKDNGYSTIIIVGTYEITKGASYEQITDIIIKK